MGGGRFTGSAALVTGGGSGLGLGCARRLAAEGAAVTIAGRSEQRLKAAESALAEEGLRATSVPCDVTDESAVRAAIEAAGRSAPLRVVVASAGVGWAGPIATIPVEGWNNALTTCMTGTFLTLKHAAPAMADGGGGAFTAISSAAALRPMLFLSPYCAAKAGVDMLVRTAAAELGRAGIRVNSVQPGLVRTELSQSQVDNDEIREDFLRRMAIRRLGTVEDVAAAVSFLSGDDGSWITGVTLPVDGGLHLGSGPRLDPLLRDEHAGGPPWWGLT